MQEGKSPISARCLSCTQQTMSDASRHNAPGITAWTTSTLCDQNPISTGNSNSSLPVMSVRKASQNRQRHNQRHQQQQQVTSSHVSPQGCQIGQHRTDQDTISSTSNRNSLLPVVTVHKASQNRHRHDQQHHTVSSISNSLLPVMSVRKAVKLTKQPTSPPSRSGLFLPELGVPTTRSSLPLYRRSNTLKAASTVTKRLLPQRCANRLSCSTPFTGMVTCALRTRPEPVNLTQQL